MIPSLTRAIPEYLNAELLIIKRYTNRHFTLVIPKGSLVWDWPNMETPEKKAS